MAIENMPFDKYELEPSPLTQYILERKQPNVAWQVINTLYIVTTGQDILKHVYETGVIIFNNFK